MKHIDELNNETLKYGDRIELYGDGKSISAYQIDMYNDSNDVLTQIKETILYDEHYDKYEYELLREENK